MSVNILQLNRAEISKEDIVIRKSKSKLWILILIYSSCLLALTFLVFKDFNLINIENPFLDVDRSNPHQPLFDNKSLSWITKANLWLGGALLLWGIMPYAITRLKNSFSPHIWSMIFKSELLLINIRPLYHLNTLPKSDLVVVEIPKENIQSIDPVYVTDRCVYLEIHLINLDYNQISKPVFEERKRLQDLGYHFDDMIIDLFDRDVLRVSTDFPYDLPKDLKERIQAFGYPLSKTKNEKRKLSSINAENKRKSQLQ